MWFAFKTQKTVHIRKASRAAAMLPEQQHAPLDLKHLTDVSSLRTLYCSLYALTV